MPAPRSRLARGFLERSHRSLRRPRRSLEPMDIRRNGLNTWGAIEYPYIQSQWLQERRHSEMPVSSAADGKLPRRPSERSDMRVDTQCQIASEMRRASV